LAKGGGDRGWGRLLTAYSDADAPHLHHSNEPGRNPHTVSIYMLFGYGEKPLNWLLCWAAMRGITKISDYIALTMVIVPKINYTAFLGISGDILTKKNMNYSFDLVIA
jgi:hypothetical protein